MSVLLAYGTSTEAVIMSDSRTTLYKNKNGIGKIGHKEKQRIFLRLMINLLWRILI